jgi:TM2 domain-containing membrane protein YozV
MQGSGFGKKGQAGGITPTQAGITPASPNMASPNMANPGMSGLDHLRNGVIPAKRLAETETTEQAAAMVEAYDYSLSFGERKPEKSVMLAYLIWFLLGQLSAHRFYLGSIQSGIIQIGFGFFGLALVLVGSPWGFLGIFFLIIWGMWVLGDVFMIPSIHRKYCLGSTPLYPQTYHA